MERAAEHGDEHVVKLTGTATEEHARTDEPDAHAALIGPAGD